MQTLLHGSAHARIQTPQLHQTRGTSSADPGIDAEKTTVLERLGAWRHRGTRTLTDRATAEACEVIGHSYERLYAGLSATTS